MPLSKPVYNEKQLCKLVAKGETLRCSLLL